MVVKAELLRLSCLIAIIAIKNQEPLFAFSSIPSVFIEVLNPLEAKLIVCLAILTHSNLPG
jgi:hypothetical protein